MTSHTLHRRDFLKGAFVAAGAMAIPGLAGCSGSLADASRPTKPNILFVLVDDMGWGDVSCNGGAGVPTPNIDRIAKEGVRFTNFYVASPICSPSRCGLITGQFPGRWRLTSYLQTRAGNRHCEQADFLDPAAPSFVRAFKSAGYATAHIGKWHLGGGRDVTDAPKFSAYGYDLGLGTYESPEPCAELGLKSTPWDQQTEPQQVLRHDRTRWMVDQTLAFAKKNPSQPWLVNLWLDDIHTPHRPSKEQLADAGSGAGTPEYRAVLRETDRQISRLLDGLRDLRMDTNTLIILAGDNGPQPPFKPARSAGLRGMKASLYEGGIRTPCVARWPDHIPAGTVNDTVISAVDLFPTLCSLAGIARQNDTVTDGENLAAAFRGEKIARTKMLFWEYGRKPSPQDKTTPNGFPYPPDPADRSPNVAVLDGKWKLLVNADGTGVELYDLASDPTESKNVVAGNPDIAQRLVASALAWRKSLP